MAWRKSAFGLALAVAAWLSAVAADLDSPPFVSPMFGDNMVLQRGKPNTVWGWSKPGDVVRVEISGLTAKAVAGLQGY
jgi:sialate O-acetylesterase